jgi:hypothetical protein
VIFRAFFFQSAATTCEGSAGNKRGRRSPRGATRLGAAPRAGAESVELLQGLFTATCAGIGVVEAVAVRVYAGLSRSG